jgi:hypothetical protein
MAWQRINDFSSGIRQIVSANYPPGTAHASGTFRCYSRDSGVLAPLPRRVNNFFLTDGNFPTYTSEEVRVIGLHVRDPLFWPAETTTGVEQTNSEVLFGLEYLTSTGQTFEMWRFLRHYSLSPAYRRVWSYTESGVSFNPIIRPKHMEFQTGRSNNTDPNQGGPIVTAFCVNGHLHMFPDDTGDLLTDSTRYLPGDKVADSQNSTIIGLIAPDHIVAHQGVLVVFPLTLVGGGYNSIYTNNEAFYWTEVNDWRTLNGELDSYLQMIVGWENPTGYQVMQSLTRSQLLLIKSKGGAILIDGDINDPNPIQLPYVRGSGLSMNKGVITPKGLMYPVDAGGIWLWSGGESSEHVTPYMLPDFWRPAPTLLNGDPAPWGHGYTQCAQWNEWTLFPNNWLFDTDRDAMWRLDDPDEICAHRWDVDWRGKRAYGAPAGMRDVGDPVFFEYDLTHPSNVMSWRSQPLAHSIDTHLEVCELAVRGQGKGNITVRVTSDQNTEGSSVTFSGGEGSDPEYQWAQRATIAKVSGTHIQFSVTSRAAVESDPAPEVHELAWDENPGNPPAFM